MTGIYKITCLATNKSYIGQVFQLKDAGQPTRESWRLVFIITHIYNVPTINMVKIVLYMKYQNFVQKKN